LTPDDSVIDLWYQAVTGNGKVSEDELVFALKQEYPGLISAVFERGCTLQCVHCFYQAEAMTAAKADKHGMGSALKNLTSELIRLRPCHLLHAGRILRHWHVRVLRDIKLARPGVKIGLIDSGNYTDLIEVITREGLAFDWLDISLDGPNEAHNKQRRNQKAFQMASNGLARAREVLTPDGRLTCLFTLTTINAHTVAETADIALEQANEFHLSPISPRHGLEELVPSEHDIEAMWEGVLKSVRTHGRDRVMVRMYSASELLRLAKVIGSKTVWQAFAKTLVFPETAGCLLDLDGVRVSFFPPSLWPKEEIIVDADAHYRLGYSGQFTLVEHQQGRSVSGQDISSYTVAKLTSSSCFAELYPRCVETWWRLLGHKKFEQEAEAVAVLQGS